MYLFLRPRLLCPHLTSSETSQLGGPLTAIVSESFMAAESCRRHRPPLAHQVMCAQPRNEEKEKEDGKEDEKEKEAPPKVGPTYRVGVTGDCRSF